MFSSIRRFFGYFINRTTLTIFFLLLLSLLIWYVGPLVAISVSNAKMAPLGPEWIRWTVIAVIWLLYLIKVLVRWWRQRNMNDALLSQLAKMQSKPGEGQTAGSEEVAELGRRFKEAADVLKKTRFSANEKGGVLSSLSNQYVYQLPWYAFIGAPGSGKTTALVNAGLTFPLAEQFGKAAIRGVGGTRNCDWWFTNEAVLIDTAGRYTTQESNQSVDKAEWAGFMGLLRKFRPRQPLNGVMLTLSVSDLLQMSAQEREVHAATLKARLAELRDGLGVQFPVYVLVTKADLLSGFQEYFLNCSREERAQVWGFTLPYNPKDTTTIAVREHFNQEFDLLYQRLNAGMHERLLAEPDLSRRALAYALPQQLSGLRDVIGRLLASVFAESKFNEQPLLRGVYFTSATQEGTPFDRVLGAMQRTFKVPSQVAGVQGMAGTGKSFFLQDLLQKVVFPEHFIAGRNLAAERRLRAILIGGLAACALLFVGANIAWSPFVSYGNNTAYITEVGTKALALRTTVEAIPAAVTEDAPALLPVLNEARSVAVSQKFDFNNVPWGYRYGLYQGDKLDTAGQIAYSRLLEEAFLPRIATRLESLLRASPPGNSDYLYQALKAYLMLGGAGPFSADALKLWIQADWTRSLPTATVEQRKQLDEHLDALMQGKVVISPFPLNQDLVKNAREVLNQQPPANRTYSRIKSRLLATTDTPEFTIARVAGLEAPNVLVRASKQPLNAGIPGLFTAAGYPKFQKELAVAMADMGLEDAWVLGRVAPTTKPVIPNPIELAQQTQQVTRLYLTEYAKQWQEYLNDVRLIGRNSLSDTIAVTRILASVESPLLLLARAAAKETTLIRSDTGGSTRVDQALSSIDRLKQEVTAAAGLAGGLNATTGLDDRIEMIVQGPFSLLHAVTKGAPGTAPLDGLAKVLDDYLASLVAAESALRGGTIPRTQDAENRLKSEAARMPQPVRNVLEALLSQATVQISGGTRASAAAGVKGGVGQTCGAVIAGRYPVARGSAQDIQTNDFAQVFAPGGLMDETFQKNLAPFVDTSRPTWAPRPGPEGAAAGSAGDLAQFQRASVIRDAFFTPGSRTMKFDLIVRVVSLGGADKVDIDIDGQGINATPANDGSKRISWPGTRGTNQVRLTVGKAPPIDTTGAWALHRLIDKGQVQGGTSPERVLVNYNLDGKTVGIEFIAQSVRNPLRLPQLEGFACPGRG